MDRPRILDSITGRERTGCGNLYVISSYDERGDIVEVFVTLGKAGACASCLCETVGRIISVALREGVLLDPLLRQLRGVECPNPVLRGARSCVDALAEVLTRARVLIRRRTEEDHESGDAVPDAPGEPDDHDGDRDSEGREDEAPPSPVPAV